MYSTLYIQVCFVGEPAIDTGGPTREFWRLLISAFQNSYCIGDEGRKVLDHNVPALEVYILCIKYKVCLYI